MAPVFFLTQQAALPSRKVLRKVIQYCLSVEHVFIYAFLGRINFPLAVTLTSLLTRN